MRWTILVQKVEGSRFVEKPHGQRLKRRLDVPVHMQSSDCLVFTPTHPPSCNQVEQWRQGLTEKTSWSVGRVCRLVESEAQC